MSHQEHFFLEYVPTVFTSLKSLQYHKFFSSFLIISQITRQGKRSHFIDGGKISTSSSLRFINCATSGTWENVSCYQCAGKLFCMTQHDIFPGQELLIDYGDQYAKLLRLLSDLQ